MNTHTWCLIEDINRHITSMNTKGYKILEVMKEDQIFRFFWEKMPDVDFYTGGR